MNIMAFVDTHGNIELTKKLVERGKKEDVDVIVCAGDFTVFDKNMDEVLELLDSIGKTVLVIPGNHEVPDVLEKHLRKRKKLVNIHEQIYRRDGITFLGWGTDGFTRRSQAFRKVARAWRRKLNSEDKMIVLVTHAPPYNTALDALDKEHVGNADIRKEIELIKPELAISGHIHETEGKSDKVGETLVVNPGKNGMVLKV